tara:strand:- start:343 stop:1038 length:696 start_codon:yes stop_codon:yes gene_type:complete
MADFLFGKLMIVKIEKNISDMKIGILGTRADCFSRVLDRYKVEYSKIEIDEIDKSYDFIFESGVYKIIPEDILSLPTYGIVGIHESPLPEGKGHAPIQWAVLNGRKNLTITLYRLNRGVDSGQIINQHNVAILKEDTLTELNRKRESGISECFKVFLDEIISGHMVLRDQSGKGSYHKRRDLNSCELDLEEKLGDLWDNIRICDNEKYPAWFRIGNKKITLRYEVTELEDI